jgi:hypothetical protein
LRVRDLRNALNMEWMAESISAKFASERLVYGSVPVAAAMSSLTVIGGISLSDLIHVCERCVICSEDGVFFRAVLREPSTKM